jgi:hypothetical protein
LKISTTWASDSMALFLMNKHIHKQLVFTQTPPKLPQIGFPVPFRGSCFVEPRILKRFTPPLAPSRFAEREKTRLLPLSPTRLGKGGREDRG